MTGDGYNGGEMNPHFSVTLSLSTAIVVCEPPAATRAESPRWNQSIITVYTDMNKRRGCTTDDIAFQPDFRTKFLNRCRQSLGSDRPEKELLKGSANLRKRSKLPRSTD